MVAGAHQFLQKSLESKNRALASHVQGNLLKFLVEFVESNHAKQGSRS